MASSRKAKDAQPEVVAMGSAKSTIYLEPAANGHGVVLFRQLEIEPGLRSTVRIAWFRDREAARQYMLSR